MSQNKTPDVLMFTAKAIYSLDPKEESGHLVVQDIDGETISLLGLGHR